jgi:plastocyanin
MKRSRLALVGALAAAAIAVAVGVGIVRSRKASQANSAGALGFTNRVYSLIDGQRVLTMAEGPEGQQVRCQQESLPCSYLRLKALRDSAQPIPAELHLTRAELSTLVDQLARVSRHLAGYHNNINRACAEGYVTRSPQIANMGIHLTSSQYLNDGIFDLEKPEMLLFAVEGADQLPKKDVGDCVDGHWTGDPEQQIVGAAYVLATKDVPEGHPAGFAGPFDNWHVHYHVCYSEMTTTSVSQRECEKHGGYYRPDSGWMLHVYAVPEFDNPLGVFGVWNPTIWPKTDAEALLAERDARTGPDMFTGNASGGHHHDMSGESKAGFKESVIFEFKFTDVEIKAGETVVFRNADSAYHTVTAGTPDQPSGAFDSGRIGLDRTFARRFAQPGRYPIFCTMHHDMTGVVVVK